MDYKVIVVFFGTLITCFILDWVECSIIGTKERQNQTTACRDSKELIVQFILLQTIYGEIYDCVDIDKQPALQHPALVEHQIEISPGKKYVDALKGGSFKYKDNVGNVWLEKGCPSGTVPIPRTSRKHLRKVKYLDSNALNYSQKYNGGLEFAGENLRNGGDGYYGASANIAIHNPSVKSGSHQYSAASIIIINGDTSVEAGWIVHEDLYHDLNTRLYTYWTNDNHKSTGCFNIDCPGFVIVSDEYPLNYVFNEVSDPKFGKMIDWKFTIEQRDVSGRWWFSFNDTILGYWPQSLFANFGSADSVRFGGQIYSPPPTNKSPPMGSGKFYGDNPYRTAYMKEVTVDFKDNMYGAPPKDLVEAVITRCYYAGWESYSSNPSEGYSFLYGETGGEDDYTCIGL